MRAPGILNGMVEQPATAHSQGGTANGDGDTGYPCPVCGADADPDRGCAACGSPPDRVAAEVIRLNAVIPSLTTEVETLRQRYFDAAERLRLTRTRRDALARQVRAGAAGLRPAAATGAERPAGPQVARPGEARPATRPEAPSPAAPEASTRTVQNTLFVLGGLLLASAAIVFTAVAWASFGVAGRAAILAGMTLVTLLIPPPTLRRELRGTAETFGVLGLLLVLLDGYAAWYVNLGDVADTLEATTYAGVVAAITSAVAVAYGLMTGLTGPRFAAVVVAQPVLPLLAGASGFGPAGWSMVFATIAAADVLVARLSRTSMREPERLAMVAIAWVFGAVTLLVATLSALAALVLASTPGAAGRASAVAVLIASVLLWAAIATGLPKVVDVCAAIEVITIVGAGAWFLAAAWPDTALLGTAALVVAVAVAVAWLPSWVRHGPRAGALTAASLLGAVLAARALWGAAATAANTLPAWRAIHEPTPTPLDWQDPPALVATALALVVLLGRRAWAHSGAATAVLLALSVPAVLEVPWWTPALADAVVGVPLAVAAALTLRHRDAVARALGAAALAAHAVLIGLADAVATATVTACLAAAALTMATLARRRVTAIGRAAVATAILTVPAVAAALGEILGPHRQIWHTPVPLAYALAAALLTCAAIAAVRGNWPEYTTVAAGTVVTAATTITLVAATVGAPFGVFAALSLAGTAVAASLAGIRHVRIGAPSPPDVPSRLAWIAGSALITTVFFVVAVTPAVVTVLFGQYRWLGSIWSGAPDGAGIAPHPTGDWRADTPFADGLAAVALGILSALVGFVGALLPRGSRLFTAIRWAAPPAMLAALVGCVALDAPWPVTPAVSVACGLVSALIAALRRPVRGPLRGYAGFAWLGVAAGVAGSLATSVMTLVSLSAVVVVAVICGSAGRTGLARVSAWIVALAGGGLLAYSAGAAAGLPPRWIGYWVLLPATAALAGAVVLRRVDGRATAAPPAHATPADTTPAAEGVAPAGAGRGIEQRVLSTGAHVTAVVALLLALGWPRHMAGVCTLWGLAVGLRALLPDQRVSARRATGAAAAGCQLLAYWLLLAANEVALIEAYTVPAAGVALLCGVLAVRSRPTLRSWVAYGPALLAGFAPSLASVFGGGDAPLRRLALGAAGVLVVVVGSTRRLQAPVVVGGSVLLLLAAYEVVAFWDLLPRWLPLAVAGLVLLTVATTYERRRRDLARLRAAVEQMR